MTGRPAEVGAHAEREEEALRRGEPAVVVSVVEGSPAVSIGVSVREDAAWVAAARAAGLRVVRRRTGGTGVLHQAGDLLWATVLPRSDPRVGPDYVRAYPRLGAPVVTWLARWGVPAAWGEPPGASPSYCPLGDRGQVLRSRARILGGAAQHATSRALLHHGFVARTVDRATISSLFTGTAEGASGLLGGLEELGVRETPGRLAATLAEEAGAWLLQPPAR